MSFIDDFLKLGIILLIPVLILYKWVNISGNMFTFVIKPDFPRTNCLLLYFILLLMNSPIKINSGYFSHILLVNLINKGFGYIFSIILLLSSSISLFSVFSFLFISILNEFQ